MIYDYVVTKPPLNEETLAHYGIKGMKWKKRKAKLKGKALELRAKVNRKLNGVKDPNTITGKNGKGIMPNPGYGKYGDYKSGNLTKGTQAGRSRAGMKSYGGGENWNPKTNDERLAKKCS